MGTLLVLPPAFLRSYMSRTLRGVQVPEAAMPAMRRSLGFMLGVLVFHVGLTIYAAFALSLAAWGFISGGLLYILFGLVALGQLIPAWRARRAARAQRGEEILPLVDEEGKVLGTAARSECHRGPGKLHPVVHLHIFDGAGRMYLQKRALDKLVEPGKWDTAVGGHVSAGEDLETALARELREELGVGAMALEASGAKPQALLRYRWETAIESELAFVFALRYEGPFAPDPGEVLEGRFWDQAEIRSKLGSGLFTPNFEHEFAMFQQAAEKSQ
jgi:isopentenyldiphosphate isomerase